LETIVEFIDRAAREKGAKRRAAAWFPGQKENPKDTPLLLKANEVAEMLGLGRTKV